MDAQISLAILIESLDSEFDSEEGLEENPYCSFKVDSVYEKNRKMANREIFKRIINCLRLMKEHAKMGSEIYQKKNKLI